MFNALAGAKNRVISKVNANFREIGVKNTPQKLLSRCDLTSWPGHIASRYVVHLAIGFGCTVWCHGPGKRELNGIYSNQRGNGIILPY